MSHQHDHSSNHDHEQLHQHDHAQSAPATAGDPEKTKALLAYMIHHNEHHAEELADLLNALPKPVQEKLLLAIGTFEAANIELQDVLDSLE